MTPPVFTVEPAEKKAQLNLLPCRIQYDGDVDAPEMFWNPTQSQDGTKTAYFRGRKLDGKTVRLPSGYRGAVVEKSEPEPEQRKNDDGVAVEEEDAEVREDPGDQLPVGAMRGKASFDEVTVWGHESLADAREDPYVRGMEEWIAFAEQVHSYPAEAGSAKV